jgi:transposase
MFTSSAPLALTQAERNELQAMLRSTTIPAGFARRAQIILALDDGDSYDDIALRMRASITTVGRWKRRFQEGRIGGLLDAPRRGRGHAITPAIEARILRLTKQGPPKPFTHWSVRRLAVQARVSPATVHRVWQRAGLKPHRVERYTATTDPDFEQKAADIIGLYLNPPRNAAVFCVDEKTSIQALDRVDPVLPLSPGRAERHGFEYVRHGTLSLYAALEIATGRVQGKATARHTSEDFLAFMDHIVSGQRASREIHIVLDNFRAHKTKAVEAWLEAHPTVHFHYTPTYSSWLNQVELWFAKIERDMIARGIFHSATDLRRKLMQYIRLHNKSCRPFLWRYSNPKRRIRAIVN